MASCTASLHGLLLPTADATNRRPEPSNLNGFAHLSAISHRIERGGGKLPMSGGKLPMKRNSEYGGRKHERVDLRRPVFVVLAPDGPWFDCMMLDISEGGACLDVGALAVPKIFALVLTPSGDVRRACLTAWRRGPLLGARFVGIKELRRGLGPREYVDPRLQKIPICRDEI